jgi:hypothetical protein
MTVELKNHREQVSNGPYNRFLYALKAPESKRQYPKRLEVFLNFLKIEGSTLEEKLYNLYNKPVKYRMAAGLLNRLYHLSKRKGSQGRNYRVNYS